MLERYHAFIWSVPAFLILLCEIYVPYRGRIFWSMFCGAFLNVILCDFVKDVFTQCVLFIFSSIFAYTVLCIAVSVKKRKKHDPQAAVIALCDIARGNYGTVFWGGRSYIIKNLFSHKINKGEVILMDKKELEVQEHGEVKDV